jgi:F-box interacting protein
MRVHRFKPLRLHTLYNNETLWVSGVVDPRELFQYEVAGLSMFGPCNGILCFFATLRKDRHWHNYNRALLWNPTTRESKILPPPPDPKLLDVPLIFLSKDTLGFGFDPKTNDYKIVRIMNFRFRQCKVQVYHLRSNSWRLLDSSPNPSYFIQSPRFPSYLNGVHYWLARVRDEGNCMGRRLLLISFDMSNEVFKEVLLLPPPTEGCNCIDQDIAIINDSVTLILKFPHDWKHSFEIWVLNECGVERNWTKTLTIIRQIPVFRNLIQLREDGLVVLTTDDEHLVLYNPITQAEKCLQINGDGFAQLVSYTESLVLLNG